MIEKALFDFNSTLKSLKRFIKVESICRLFSPAQNKDFRADVGINL